MRQNILVVRLSSLGDIVLTTPVYRNLKAHWPGCRITALVKPQFRAALEGHPCVDEVLPFLGLADALRRVRAGGFTHLLDLHATFRSWVLRTFGGVPDRIRYRKDALARRLFVAWRRPAPALAKHTIDRYLEALSAWGVQIRQRSLELGDSRTSAAPQASARRVLLVQTAFLGDATLTIPLARGLKDALPGCRLTVLARPDCAEIFRAASCVDETLPDDKRARHAGLSGLLALARELRERRFELAVVPHRSLRSALIAWLARVPRRIGFSSSAGSLLFTQTIPFSWGMHDLERNLSLLLPLQADPGHRPDTSARLTNTTAAIAQRLKQAGIRDGARLVGIHPGSVWPTKRWPAERYGALIRRLSLEAGALPILVGGSGDAALAADVIREAGVPAVDWTGKTTLSELIALMERFSLFVTNDSGPMHVAAASGVPTLAVFGPTTKELGFFPYGPGHRVLEKDLACRPCGLHGSKSCPEGHFLCMRLITVDEAFRNAAEMLATRTPAAMAPR